MMWAKVKRMLLTLPIIRLMREHKAGELRASEIEAEADRRQHEIARRVHVLEWMSPPHEHHATQHRGPNHHGG